MIFFVYYLRILPFRPWEVEEERYEKEEVATSRPERRILPFRPWKVQEKRNEKEEVAASKPERRILPFRPWNVEEERHEKEEVTKSRFERHEDNRYMRPVSCVSVYFMEKKLTKKAGLSQFHGLSYEITTVVL